MNGRRSVAEPQLCPMALGAMPDEGLTFRNLYTVNEGIPVPIVQKLDYSHNAVLIRFVRRTLAVGQSWPTMSIDSESTAP